MARTLSRREATLTLLNKTPQQKKSKTKQYKLTSSDNCGDEVTTTISPYTGNFDRQALLHLLKRTLFGVRIEDINHFSGMSMSQVVDELLQVPDQLTSSPLRDYQSEGPNGEDWAGVAMGEPWADSPLDFNNGGIQAADDNVFRTFSLRKWNMGIALDQDRSVYEKMVLFWHNHFPISAETVNRSQRSYLYTKLIRENVNTDLREFCKKITKDPAMLSYLNGEVNTVDAPDENFAREIQELFTIGKEVPADKRYTEDDVKAFARALTGHGIDMSNWLDAVYQFATWRHAGGDKQLSAFYSNEVIQGGTGSSAGDDELNQLIDIVFDDSDNNIAPLQDTPFASWTRADIIADHLIKKIYRFFVYSDITEHVQQEIIKPLADTYKQNDFKILPVLQQLFTSEHFYDEAFRGAYIKTPYDAAIGLLRTMWVNTHHDDAETQYAIFNHFQTETEDMQQGALEPPNVAGWPAYYQQPQFQKLWINADTLPKRQRFARDLVDRGQRIFAPGVFLTLDVDYISLLETFTDPHDPNSVIDQFADLLLGIPLSDDHKEQLKRDTLLSGQQLDSYWSQAWQDAVNGNATNTAISRLRSLLTYMVRLEEYQLT